MKVLNLVLKKKWFDMIVSGDKKEEYREMKKYWHTRLISKGRDFTHVRFRCGYAFDSPVVVVECLGIRADCVSSEHPEWAEPDSHGYFYVISLGEIVCPF